ncbi:MAG: SDR family oxidoreductase [Chitinophagia bacterium]|jgi:short-subunit dehydrogenase|nr:SDR family oxidoreductase [Chitinophagia bacterium]NCA29865.1 SDR family oxidoreductase [Chitinophagia bacterium]
MSNFTDKIVVITGGSDGIGKALVAQFLALGAKVATCGRSVNKLSLLTSEFSASNLFTAQVDVSKQNESEAFIMQVVDKWGRIDILINNAGISMRALVSEVSVQTLQNVMDINFWGTVYCTKAALPSIQQNKGVIVGVSSIAGYRGLPGRSGYSASKFALNGWLEALKTELYTSGTHVMWVCPGFTTSNIRNAALDKNAKAHGESPMDEGAMMSSEQCATHIIHAIEKRSRSLVLTFTGKRTVFMNKYFPAWADKLVHHFFFKNGKLVK